MTHWYMADPHFGDSGIMQFFGRPFGSSQAMLEAVQVRVQADDDLWIVGDFARADTIEDVSYAAMVLDLLPGRTHLVRGNHDPSSVLGSLQESDLSVR